MTYVTTYIVLTLRYTHINICVTYRMWPFIHGSGAGRHDIYIYIYLTRDRFFLGGLVLQFFKKPWRGGPDTSFA